LLECFVTVCFSGYSPVAPGTAGTMAAMVFYWAARDISDAGRLAIAAAVLAAGIPTASRAEVLYGKKDCGRIVVDEFVGYWVAMAFLPATAGYMIAAFFAFRFFDILKPYPARMLERRCAGGWGVMLDDVAAGVYANLAVRIAALMMGVR